MSNTVNFAEIAAQTATGLDRSTVNRRRANWGPAMSNVVMPVLDRAAAEMDGPLKRMGVSAKQFQRAENFASAQLWFGKEPSGVHISDERGHSLGVQSGGALVFSQSEDGRVVVLAYPAETSLPNQGISSNRRVWMGPIFDDPAEIAANDVERLVLLFVEFARASSIFWTGPAPSGEVYSVFRRVPDSYDIQMTNDALDKIKADTATIRELSVWALPVLVEQLGELFEAAEEEQVRKVVLASTPRAVKWAARFIEVATKKAFKEEEILKAVRLP